MFLLLPLLLVPWSVPAHSSERKSVKLDLFPVMRQCEDMLTRMGSLPEPQRALAGAFNGRELRLVRANNKTASPQTLEIERQAFGLPPDTRPEDILFHLGARGDVLHIWGSKEGRVLSEVPIRLDGTRFAALDLLQAARYYHQHRNNLTPITLNQRLNEIIGEQVRAFVPLPSIGPAAGLLFRVREQQGALIFHLSAELVLVRDCSLDMDLRAITRDGLKFLGEPVLCAFPLSQLVAVRGGPVTLH